ncbi:MAG: mannose-1-phosphate guanylyltransferase [Bacteroidaceae bacterium]|nr:mannose-1-phosphate guanylyltransferase [Bacteroidaceae bacterium]
MANHVVIMAGGIGSRFWPLSTPEFPKQFIDILGCGRSLIQLTVDRFKGICPPENFWVVTNKDYVDIVKQQIPGIPDEHILAEPAARNTAPCIAWACWSIKREDPEANVVVTPSDAVVMNPEEFRRVISGALNFTAGHDFIVTIGIKPNRPETGYGYVKAVAGNQDIKAVEAFKEKPDLETAKKYLADGNYLWNAGIFVWNINTITNSIREYKPQLAEQMDLMVSDTKNMQKMQKGTVPNCTNCTVLEIFPQCEKISIDYAVMEPAAADGKVFTYPADFGWSDLGNWQSLHEKLQKDAQNNAAVGNVHFYESSNCVVHTEGLKKVVLQGLDGYIVSEKGGQLLVCRRSEEQRIKEFSAE